MIRSATWAAVSSGRYSRSNAAVAATKGAA
ncbi:hypothetical protein ONO86_01188 [Micromonospora noduli]|nr:hypothetical protein ONO86_01188 [Micromonospora noduli]